MDELSFIQRQPAILNFFYLILHKPLITFTVQKIKTHNKFVVVDIQCIIMALVTDLPKKIKSHLNSPHSIHSFHFNNLALLTSF